MVPLCLGGNWMTDSPISWVRLQGGAMESLYLEATIEFAGQRLEQGGFAAAGGTQQEGEAARHEHAVDAVQHLELAHGWPNDPQCLQAILHQPCP